MGITNGVMLMPEISQWVIKDMACPDMTTFTGPLLPFEQSPLFVEGVQHIVIFILGLTLPKYLESLAVTRQILLVIHITTEMIIHNLQG